MAECSVKEELPSPFSPFLDAIFSEFIQQPLESERKYSSSSNDSNVINNTSSNFDIPKYSSDCTSLFQSESCLDIKSSKSGEVRETTLENCLSQHQQLKVNSILDSVKNLTETERFFLYLNLPKQDKESSVVISNSKLEQAQAFQWIRTALEECDSSVNLPKHEVYDEYKSFCEHEGNKRCLSAPDFGKIVKCIFPNVKARRLGTRGNSKYCYNGLQRKSKNLQNIAARENSKEMNNGTSNDSFDQTIAATCVVLCEWANKLLGRVFSTIVDLARFLVGGSYVSTKTMSAFIVMSASDEQVVNVSKRFSLDIVSRSPSKKSGNPAVSTSCPAQVVPHTPTSISQQLKDPLLDGFTIDMSSPLFLNDQTFNLTQVEVNHIPKNKKRKPEKLPIVSPPSRAVPALPTSAPPTLYKTPKKVGRPVRSYMSPQQHHAMPPPSPARGVPFMAAGNRFVTWPNSPSFHSPHSGGMMSPCDRELINIFNHAPQTLHYPHLNRCHSVPAQRPNISLPAQPLTPQFPPVQRMWNSGMKARRNLSALFTDAGANLQNNVGIIEADIQNSYRSNFGKFGEGVLRKQEGHVGFDLSDLPTPDELSDIVSSENIGGEELIASLHALTDKPWTGVF